MKSIIKGMHNFANNINIFVSSVLLLVVYFVGVGITSILAKLVGKHFFDTDKKNSYWCDLNSKEEPIGGYYKQF